MRTISAKELEITLAVAGYVTGFHTSIVDRRYALPTRGFIEGAFSSALWSFQSFFNVLQWTEEANDCDDFARVAAGFAQILHFLTPNRPPAAALAVGELWYVKDDGTGHAINIVLCGPDPKDVLCYEPQTRQIVELTETEKNRATALRF